MLSAQELRDELMTVLVMVTETTASTLSWTFERLVRLPDVMTRLTDEVAGPDGDAYITATVQEALRRRPVLPNSLPWSGRRPIEVGSWSYPVDVCLVPNAYLRTSRSMRTPTRSGPSASSTRGPAPTWIPSAADGAGASASFAMLEMKIVIRSAREPGDGAGRGAAGARQAPQHHDHPRGGSRVTLSALARAGRLPELMAAR